MFKNAISSILQNKAVQAVVNYVKTAGPLDGIIALVALYMVFYGWDILGSVGSQEFATDAALRSLMLLLLATISLRVILLGYDLISGISFKAWWIKASPTNKATYLAARILAVAIMIGLILG